ncbi:MAG: hypothetical protein Q8922_11580 [Bacteroidota bacterium]|nr:hypothetical protein [Bacteroidota bacterium]MDP4234678.1 hypothetical protein [Bacteroidota bacterium]MDP4288566.1 hypothetical protein [Bacteroidota bacterium]
MLAFLGALLNIKYGIEGSNERWIVDQAYALVYSTFIPAFIIVLFVSAMGAWLVSLSKQLGEVNTPHE